jgi:hypothetical protein
VFTGDSVRGICVLTADSFSGMVYKIICANVIVC